LELDKTSNDILLLNSDTKVTDGFLEELIEVLNLSPKHAAVSPRSNNASIVTIPLSQAIHHGIDSKQAYKIYQKISPQLPRFYVAAVALGFCMLIRRSVIKKYGLFDPVFGKGYGEEVDFCRRVKKHGYLSIIANHAFVYHLEARSFTSELKQKLIEEHNQIIWQRYPEYRQENRDWMDEKVPAETAIEKSLGIDAEPKATGLRGALKRYPRLYRLCRKVYRRLI
jgi:GT2 family glycosyltransferase